eukprot:gene21063-27293_t
MNETYHNPVDLYTASQPTHVPIAAPASSNSAFCTDTLGPNEGCCTVNGYANDQSLSDVCLTTDVTNIGNYAFSDGYIRSSIKSIFVPLMLQTIGQYAFQQTPLKVATFVEAVEVIGQNAFYGCSHLASVTFLGAVMIFNDDVFTNSGLKTVYYPASWSIPRGKFPIEVDFISI